MKSRHHGLGVYIWTFAFVFSASVAFADTLQGGVNHSERLQPMEPGLLKGAIFDERSIPALHTRTDWYRIPKWFAGVWHRDVERRKILKVFSISHESKRFRVRGHQADAKGRVWHAHDEPSITTVDGGNSIIYMLVRVLDPVTVSKDVVVVHYVSSSFVVDKLTRAIVDVYQADDIHEFRLQSQGVLKCNTRSKYFDQFGTPTGFPVKGDFTDNLVGQFKPIDTDGRRDYFSDFTQFLMETGRADDIPARTPDYSHPVTTPSY